MDGRFPRIVAPQKYLENLDTGTMHLSKTLRTKEKSKRQKTQKVQRHKKSGIQPGDNFYQYVNHDWFSKTKIPPTKSAFGVSEEIEHRIDTQIESLLEECIKHPDSRIEETLGTLASSVFTADSQPSNLELVKAVLQSIQTIESTDDVGIFLGEFTRYKIRNLFHLVGQYENKHDAKYTFTIGIGSLGLPDSSYYYKKSLRRGVYFSLYKRMLKRLGDLFDLPTLPCVVKLEHLLAGVLWNLPVEPSDVSMTGSELQKTFQHIPLGTILKTIGIPSWHQRLFFIESKPWLQALNKLFHHLELDQWKLLLSLEFLLFALPWLPSDYSRISFQFYRKELKGQEKPLSRKEQAVYVVEQYASSLLSHVYVDKLVDKSVKPHVTEMLEDLKVSAQERLGTLTWLEEPTRKKAQEKVKRMRSLVAFPDHFEHHRIPRLESHTLLANLLELGEWETEVQIQKLDQPISQRKEWDDAVYAVNAYYYSQANEMILPAGILNAPFYDSKNSFAKNFGGLGCIIGHEMTHAFDEEGKEYDPRGFTKRWWTLTDKRRYTHLTKDLIEVYGHQKIKGFPVSGKKTLSENIADIGGMAIALRALQTKLDRMPLTSDERNQAYQDFFSSYAISWRVKERERKSIQALLLDKHAPPALRVNLVVSQFQEWYDAFQIQPSDPLYIPPEKRIHIL
jgi:putative endopeptidase